MAQALVLHRALEGFEGVNTVDCVGMGFKDFGELGNTVAFDVVFLSDESVEIHFVE